VLEKISSDFDHLGSKNISVNTSNLGIPCWQHKLEGITHISPPKVEIHDQYSANGRRVLFPCTFCPKILHYGESLRKHMKAIHKNAVKCKSKRCNSYFSTEPERQQHEEKFHLNGEFNKAAKCIYCGALKSRGTLSTHIKKQHKDAIKCDFNKTCPNYFHTESEKNKHILEVHTEGLQRNLTPEQCIYCGKICNGKHCLRLHVTTNHADIRIKCRSKGCVVYFLSQKESDAHFLQVHQHAESLKRWQCPKCSYKTNRKKHWQQHFKEIHGNIATAKSTFNCLLCLKSFCAKIDLNSHLNTVHAERCTCQHCGKSMQKKSLRAHFIGGACKPTLLL
jgi:hypothetical protein